MKKLLLTTAIIMAMGGTTVLAHHPAADIVDPDVYAMITENISTQHLDLDFDEMDNNFMATDENNGTEESSGTGVGTSDAMGGDTSDVGAATEAFDIGQAEFSGDVEAEVGEAFEQRQINNSRPDSTSPGPGK